MRMSLLLIALFAPFALLAAPQAQLPQHQQKKYPWQHEGSNCDETGTFCWYGVEDGSDPQVIAYGNRWVAQDKDEKPFEWITAVRCLKEYKLCISAHTWVSPSPNQKVVGNVTETYIDLYRVVEWTSVQIRATGENFFPPGEECEFETLLLNRVEGLKEVYRCF